jgi:hypothetical protein
MDLDAASLVASLVVSSIGLVAFMYGRSQERLPQVVAGLLLMAFPYFVPNIFAMLGIAAAILLGMWIAMRRDW